VGIVDNFYLNGTFITINNWLNLIYRDFSY